MQATENNAGGAASGPMIEKLGQPDRSQIRHVIAVMSGKGGVGKSSISALLAVSLARKGFQVGLLDADITGPSIPKLFGLNQQPVAENGKIAPPKTALGIKVISLNLLLPNEDDPVVWRGPLIGGAVKQFWTDVLWGEIDYLVVDLPPGTGDAPLTVMQSLPLDGLLIVTSPQELAVMVVKKAIKMARMLQVPLLGLVENMSGLTCPHCGKPVELFGPSRAEEVAAETGIKLLGTIPLDPEISRLGDRGEIEQYRVDFLEEVPSLVQGK
ncbi:MAG: Mrp/NBP35 family ATP-binding protein [Firmicutes bacterium]|jgi:Mrp family chromosome partitioning ATPase|nr:Mrp/NBP35 family ATP-binding protein [Bacillota bacterium]